MPQQPNSAPFPYTTLFRSIRSPGPSRAGPPERVLRACVARAVHGRIGRAERSEEHTSELQSRRDLVCRLLLAKKNGGKCTDWDWQPDRFCETSWRCAGLWV